MFDEWVGGYSSRALRVFDPPRPVLVAMSDVVPGGLGLPITGRDVRPLWVRGAGADLERVMAGRQRAWLLESTGSWLALVEVRVRSVNGQSEIALHLLARPEHLQLDSPEARRRSGLPSR